MLKRISGKLFKTAYIYLLFLFVPGILLMAGCNNNPSTEEESSDFFAMDTYMTVTAYGDKDKAKEAVKQAQDRIYMLDSMLSATNKNSQIYMLNENGFASFSKEAAYLMERSFEVNRLTEGAFNPAIYPVMKLWGFTDDNYRVPAKEEIAGVLSDTNMNDIVFDKTTGSISFSKPDMKIGFGGIAKGYASSEIMKIFRDNNISHGIVSLGGNIQVMGSRPDGNPWNVAIKNVDESADYIGVLHVSDKAVITSGGYERFFENNGKVYHHIIDPSTGEPADSGILSATIVSEDGTLADALSTAVYVMGADKAVDFWKKYGNSEFGSFEEIILTDTGKLYVTEGVADIFDTGLEVTVVNR